MTMFNCTFTFPFSINNKDIVTFYTFVFSITMFTIIYITGWQAIQLFSTSIINVFGFFKACFTLSTRITFSMCTVIFIHWMISITSLIFKKHILIFTQYTRLRRIAFYTVFVTFYLTFWIIVNSFKTIDTLSTNRLVMFVSSTFFTILNGTWLTYYIVIKIQLEVPIFTSTRFTITTKITESCTSIWFTFWLTGHITFTISPFSSVTTGTTCFIIKRTH